LILKNEENRNIA